MTGDQGELFELRQRWTKWCEMAGFYRKCMELVADQLDAGSMTTEEATAKLRHVIALSHTEVVAVARTNAQANGIS